MKKAKEYLTTIGLDLKHKVEVSSQIIKKENFTKMASGDLKDNYIAIGSGLYDKKLQYVKDIAHVYVATN